MRRKAPVASEDRNVRQFDVPLAGVVLHVKPRVCIPHLGGGLAQRRLLLAAELAKSLRLTRAGGGAGVGRCSPAEARLTQRTRGSPPGCSPPPLPAPEQLTGTFSMEPYSFRTRLMILGMGQCRCRWTVAMPPPRLPTRATQHCSPCSRCKGEGAGGAVSGRPEDCPQSAARSRGGGEGGQDRGPAPQQWAPRNL